MAWTGSDDLRRHTVQRLRQQLALLEGTSRVGEVVQGLSSGCAALDSLLPQGQWRPGTLVEWLWDRPGAGAGLLAWVVGKHLTRQAARSRNLASGPRERVAPLPKLLAVVDPEGSFYPPAFHVDPCQQRWLWVRRLKGEETFWALEQLLRCPGVFVVWGALREVPERWWRPLQWAAEAGGTLGFLVRPARARSRISWAEAQLLVDPLPGPLHPFRRRFRVQALRVRGGRDGQAVVLELDQQQERLETLRVGDATHLGTMASRLAHPAPAGRAAGA